MVRVDDPDRVFDVSRPGRTAAGATSRPLVVGHRPQVTDPMVQEDNPYAEFGEEKKVTPVPVTWDAPEENAHTPAANDFGGNSAFEESSLQDNAVATEPEVDVETKATHHENRPSVDTLFAPDNHADKSSWTGDGQPPVTALPLAHSAGAGPRRSVKKMLAWLGAFLVLAGAGTYLAIDAGLVGANIKLPFEFFKEKKAAPAVTTSPEKSKSNLGNFEPELKPLGTKTLSPFTLTADWTYVERPGVFLKFAYPKAWNITDNSGVNGVELQFTSPDYKTILETAADANIDKWISEGGSIFVQVSKSNIPDLETLHKEAGGYYFEPDSKLKIDGIDALYGPCGHFEPGHCAYVIHLKNIYSFSYTQPDRETIKSKTGKEPATPKDKYLEDFNKFLSSIQFTDQ